MFKKIMKTALIILAVIVALILIRAFVIWAF